MPDATTPATEVNFPTEYLTALDELFVQESVYSQFFEDGAEFANNKTVMIPEIVFNGDNKGTRAYNRFATEDTLKVVYTPYELEKDREKVIYIDAVDNIDTANLQAANAMRLWTKEYFVPEYDQYFATSVLAKSGTKATETITKENVIEQFRAMRTAMTNAGHTLVDVWVTNAVKYALEDAIQRQFAGESAISDVVGRYNDFIIHCPGDARMGGMDFFGIGGGKDTIKGVMKRAASYAFAPGQHTQGDGFLYQNRWVYGTLGRKNKVAGIYTNKHA